MPRRRLVWQLVPSYVLLTVVTVAAAMWYASRSARDAYQSHMRGSLEAQAHLLQGRLPDRLTPAAAPGVDALCKTVGRATGTRFTVLAPDGEVFGDSLATPDEMDNHGARPEVREALTKGVGHAARFSATRHEPMMYVAIPYARGGDILGVIRAAVPTRVIDDKLYAIYMRIAGGGLVALIAAALISVVVARRMARPLEEMHAGAERFAAGDLRSPVPLPNTYEMAALADTLNHMARQLDDRVRSLVEQRNEQQAVLASMVEGVIAVDTDRRVLNINRAAAGLLDISLTDVEGRALAEIIRNPDVQEFVGRALASSEAVEADIVLPGPPEKIVQARGSLLGGGATDPWGAVIVLHDITPLRRLEQVRRDFVANVSHELRTPVTSIKGFVETLLDAGLDKKDDARRFLGIIGRQADRLHAIIEDLLSLSRIEMEAERNEIVREDRRLEPLINDALEVCRARAQDKNIVIETTVDAALYAPVNAPLIEQAIINLVDNAIKYSPGGGAVRVGAERRGAAVRVTVADEGPGIPASHQARLFERFYRVDKARSRELGGTGLGLAIVKHIAQAHHGAVSVKSTVGRGSTFTIEIPAGDAGGG